MKKQKMIIYTTLLLILILGTTSLASDWNFENEKEVYKDLGNLIFYTNSDNTSLAKNVNLYTDTFTDNLFNALETKLEASSYSQSTYKFVVVKFESSTQIQFWITEEFVYPSTQLRTSYLRINVNFNSNYEITSTQNIYKGSTTTAGNIKSSSTTPNAFYLSNSISTNIGIENESIPYYSLENRHGLNYSSNEIQKINKFATVEAVLINKEYDIGNNYNVDVKYYYYDNNNKIYVTDKILKNTNSYWWGVTETPYIAVNEIQELPRGIYYADYIFTLKNTTYNDYSYSTTKEVFKIVESDTDDGETGGEVTPSGDNGGGTTIPDYSEKLDNIQEELNNIQETIPTSGEITSATIEANKDYWGNSEELNGEEQEELIEDKVNELIESVSGDLGKNEIFGILKTYEDKLFGSFTGQQDFKISWNDISYMGSKIIPKGEINFSEICRENETLGKVKTTVNIILGFLMLLNCIKYLYNLLLATLGIDNQYLYEKAEDKTSVTYSTNMNTGKTTETTTMRRKDGKTFRYRREI